MGLSHGVVSGGRRATVVLGKPVRDVCIATLLGCCSVLSTVSLVLVRFFLYSTVSKRHAFLCALLRSRARCSPLFGVLGLRGNAQSA